MSDSSSAFQFEMMMMLRHLNHLHRQVQWEQPPLDRSAYLLLNRLDLSGPMTIRELREALGLDDSTLNRQTAAIVRDGHAERIPDPEGGVARKFRVTAAGHNRLIAERARYEEALERVTAEWGDDDSRAFALLARRFNESFEGLENRRWERPAS